MIGQLSFKEILIDSIKEVFETMIFMDVDGAPDCDKDLDGWIIMGLISFTGPIEGCLSLSCSTEAAKSIAMNMLGLDSIEQVTESDTCDAIGEVVNMVIGRFKNHILQDIGTIEISIPSVVNGRELKNNLGEDAQKIVATVNIEDQHLAKLSILYRQTKN